jgi:hypothetical protein
LTLEVQSAVADMRAVVMQRPHIGLTSARLTCVRPLSPSWLSARDSAVRACPSPIAASWLPYLARSWSLALIINRT